MIKTRTTKQLQKFFSLLTIFSLIFQTGSGFFLAHPVRAQELTPTPEPSQEEPTPTYCPIEEPTPVPTQEAVPTWEPTLVPTEEVTPTVGLTEEFSPTFEPTVEPTTEPTTEPTIEPTSEPTPVEAISEPETSLEPEVSYSEEPPQPTEIVQQEEPTPQPTVEVSQGNEGRLSVVIIESQIELPLVENACLYTDKPDYTPTEKVLISGTGFVAGATYLLVISSDDPPPITHEVKIIANEKGEFFYSYQLDGIYRPNYKVEAKEREGNIVAETFFKDTPNTDCSSNGGTCKNSCGADEYENTNYSCQGNKKCCFPVTPTPTATPTSTPTPTATPTLTLTPTDTPTPTLIPTPSPTIIPSPSPISGFWPRCDLNCTANDVSITNLYLTNVDTSCTPGIDTSAELWATFENNMNSTRTCIWTVADIWINGVLVYDNFVSDPIGSIDGNGTKDVKLLDITWPCGSSVELKEILIMWSPPGTTSCVASCSEANPAKCYQASTGPAVFTPLIADFEADTVCYGSPTHFTDKTTGGKTPYTYAWDFDNDGTTDSTSRNPTYIYPAPGDYTAKLTVTDSNTSPATDSQEYLVSVRDCRGSITIIKDSVPDDPQDFQFTTTGSGLSSFSLDDDSDATLPNTKTFTNLQPGQYSITEGVVSGWSLSGISCNGDVTVDLSNRKVDITLPENGNVSCTFTNTLNQGKLKIVKNALGGDATFNFEIKNSQNTTVATPSVTTTEGTGDTGFIDLTPDTYKIREMFLEGWYSPEDTNPPYCLDKNQNSVGSFDSKTHQITLPLNSNDEITCYFQNIKYGKLILDKVTNPSGDPQTFDFDFYRGGNYIKTEEDLTDQNTPYEIKTIFADVWEVVEKSENGWKLVNIVCNDPDQGSSIDLNNNKAIIDIDPGETVSCAFTNSKYGSILVHKFNDRDGDGVKDSDDWALWDWQMKLFSGFDCQGDAIDQGVTNTNGNKLFSNLLAGQYSVLEVITPWEDGRDWVNTTGGVCQNVTLNAGQQANVVFGNYLEGFIKICKVNDLNGNGIYEGEPFIPGWTMYLQTPTGQTLSGVTGNDGCYTFGDLSPGNYYLSEEERTGWIRTNPTDPRFYPISFTIASGGGFVSKIYNFQLGKISGYKFEDLDGDGVKDGNEPGLSDWVIELDKNADGTVDGTATTNENGYYEFTGLTVGTYRVREQGQEGWQQTTANPSDITIQSGTIVENVNFGNFKLGKIQGRKYEDSNNDSNRDSGESYLNDWTIRLYKKNGSNWDLLGEKLTGHTGTSGQYRFEDLTLGQYKICEVLKEGWTQTSPTGTTNNVQADEAPRCRTTSINQSGQVRSGQSFGNIRYGGILIHKFEDINGNGQIDGQETGLENWQIELFGGSDCQGNPISTGLTDNKGDLEFINLIAGDYSVKEVLQQGWQTITPMCQNVTVEAGQIASVNFGNFRVGQIKACKYEDLDGDGVLDADEVGLAGVSIKLHKNADGAWVDIDTKDTGSDGCYVFADLTPGIYRLAEDLTDSDLASYSPTDGFVTEGNYRVTDSIEMTSGGVFERDFFNEPPAGLTLSKTNDKTGGASAGDAVTYTLTLANGKRKLVGVVLMDVMPSGFSFVSGSGMINGVPATPMIVGSMLLWSIGDLDSQQIINIQYQALIPVGAGANYYTNLASASGKKSATGPSVASNLASSQVPVGEVLSYSVGVGGTVLGAATGQVLGATLPAAGSNTEYLILALLFIILGFTIKKFSAKKSYEKNH